MADAALFDIDGTLIDSNDLHVKAWIEAFAEAGHRIDRETIHGQIGKGADKLVPALLPEADDALQKAIGDLHGAIFKARYLEQAQPFEGARDLLVRVHDDGVRVVLASSASRQELDHYVGLLDVKAVVHASTSIDDVESSKPAPDIFAVALEKAGVPAARAIVIGDTPYDAEGAGKLGIAAIGILAGGFDEQSLRCAGASTIYRDVAALLADYDASPFVRA